MSGNPLVSLSSRARRRGIAVWIVAVALFGSLVAQVVPANAVGTCTTKPTVFPEDQLQKGMVATGSTVIDGTTPTSFDVKILGILKDAIEPGFDLILARITGPQDFLDATGGIFAGMSGSPVSINGALVGSTSYGFFGDQTIMGITPAQQMVDLFDYPDATTSASARQAAIRGYGRPIHLTQAQHDSAAREAGVSSSDFSSTAYPIRTPLAVSGLGAQRLAKLQKVFGKLHIPVVAYSSGSVARPAHSSPTPLSPGEGFSDVISYGDLTAGAIGTTTATCGNLAVAFGHPFSFEGAAHFGMNGAETLAVDKAGEFGSYEIANITGAHGTIDQDRLAGVRGFEGVLPSVAPLLFDVTNPDLPKFRSGETDAVDQEYFPLLAAFGLLNEEDVTFDRIGDGTVTLSWVIRGVGPDGQTFHLRRDNMYYSPYDATISSIFEVLIESSQLQHSKFGKPTFTRAHFTSTVTQDQLTTTIQKVLVGSSLQPGLHVTKTLKVAPGGTIHIRVNLLDAGSSSPRTVNLTLTAPNTTGGGVLQVRAGRSFGGYFFFGAAQKASAASKVTSFESLVKKLAGAEHNYDLVAELSGSSGGKILGGGGALAPRRGSRFDVKTVSPQSDVVLGRKFIRVEIVQPKG